MAIYHLHSGFVSRSSGRTSVQSAAYICGEKLHEDYRGQIADFTKRANDIICYKTITPGNCKYKDLEVWNEIENFEDRYADKFFKNEEAKERFKESAQTAQTFVVALPNELGEKVGVELIEKFVTTRFTSRNLVTTYAIHDAQNNLHAHIQVSRRAVDENGDFASRKDREICTRTALLETRKLWADLANEFLEREGFKERITEKSFEDLGIDLQASQHRGWYSDKLGENSRIVQENVEIARENEEKILANPNIILDYLNENKAIFSQKDILEAIGRRVSDPQRVSIVFEKVLEQAVFLGESINGQFLYTGEKYQQLESDVFAQFNSLVTRENNCGAKNIEKLLSQKYAYLSAEQQRAVVGLCNKDSVGILLGRAGAGKTTAMRAVAEAYEQSGHRVIGMSLSAVASENLGKDAGIESATIAAWTHRWRKYDSAKDKFLSFKSILTEGVIKQFDWYKEMLSNKSSQLKAGDVIIIDEAGMIGAQDWQTVLNAAEKFGAKIIAVGDDSQFKPISAGDCFSRFVDKERDKGKLFELSEIRRQTSEWMCSASTEFSMLNTAEGLAAYEHHDKIHELENLQDVARKFLEIEDKGSAAMLCYSNLECQIINDAVRALKKENGTLGADLVKINDRYFALGDRLIFLENNKYIGIKNGMTGQVIGFQNGILSVTTESGNRDIKVEEYDKVNHAYAITLYKSQGKTYDNTIMIANKMMDAKAVYVGMTRHRENVDLYYRKEDFASFKELATSLSKYSHKDTVADFRDGRGNKNAARVSEYQSLRYEIASALCDINKGDGELKEYHDLKNRMREVGSEILNNFSGHKLYLQQVGLTREQVEIAIGAKPRPLSRAEQKAKEIVELYAKLSCETRNVLLDIKAQCFNVTTNKYYAKYCELRQARNNVAREILANYPLHREFVTAKMRSFFISKQSMQKQIDYEKSTAAKTKFLDKINSYTTEVAQNTFYEPLAKAITTAKQEDSLYAVNFMIHKNTYGFGLHISNNMIREYIRYNKLNVNFAPQMAEYASLLAETYLQKSKAKALSSEAAELCMKQSVCFEVLKQAQGIDRLTKDNITLLHQTSHELAKHISENNIQSLNNDSLMKEAIPAFSNASHTLPIKAADAERLCNMSKSETLNKTQTKALESERGVGIEM